MAVAVESRWTDSPSPWRLHDSHESIRSTEWRALRNATVRTDNVQVGSVLRQTVAMVLAGGQGERLAPLTRDRAKPAVPFGGNYRIIDFTLSNCINSGIRRMHVLTQYKSYSLDRHIKQAWNILQRELDEGVDVIPPQQRSSDRWYQGTADALFQNIYTIEMERPALVLVLGGDHIYKMDYSEMIAAHLRSHAELTVACTEVPRAEARRLGVMAADDAWRIRSFHEKPDDPEPMPDNPDCALASMGIYVFNTDVLVRELRGDAVRDSHHDFGKDIIPHMMQSGRRVFAYPFRDRNSGGVKYWRDIGTLDSYFDANMDLVSVSPTFNLYDSEWPIRTYQVQAPPAKTVFRGVEREGQLLDSLAGNGCIISGARVEHSILGPRVFVHSWAHVEDAVIFDDVEIGRHAKVRRAIIDKGVRIPAGERIGYDLERDRARFTVTDNGIVVIPKGFEFPVA
ncbi:MAG: glucose-1-phosphate adenylyltransferase [Deltaproteobacteria bacterium]|nr:glucose-1-phosphate adenylyltransferase [Deltaproteobacteria bacterium]MBI3388177.1 glucose-1-phosphate adenylyltransferase [Deltaproteobacteria bacterium]